MRPGSPATEPLGPSTTPECWSPSDSVRVSVSKMARPWPRSVSRRLTARLQRRRRQPRRVDQAGGCASRRVWRSRPREAARWRGRAAQLDLAGRRRSQVSPRRAHSIRCRTSHLDTQEERHPELAPFVARNPSRSAATVQCTYRDGRAGAVRRSPVLALALRKFRPSGPGQRRLSPWRLCPVRRQEAPRSPTRGSCGGSRMRRRSLPVHPVRLISSISARLTRGAQHRSRAWARPPAGRHGAGGASAASSRNPGFCSGFSARYRDLWGDPQESCGVATTANRRSCGT